jgi:hypothetical protein
MTTQSTGSPRSDSESVISALSLPAHYVLLAFRWVVSNSRFLYLIAAVLVGGSFLMSFNTDAWHWFQRSGALLVSIGALLSTRRALGLMLDALIDGTDLVQQVQGEQIATSEAGELQTCVCGFLLVAMGTLIWAYGDLLGCLSPSQLACLA